METLTIQIGGMSCQGCVKSVSGVLSALPGVDKVDVSLEGNCATVSFDPARIDQAGLRAAIEEAGFDAE